MDKKDEEEIKIFYKDEMKFFREKKPDTIESSYNKRIVEGYKKIGKQLDENGDVINLNKKNKKLWDEFYGKMKYVMWYPGEPEIKFFGRESKRRDVTDLKGLDFGCGIGRNTFLMTDFRIKSYGIDVSENAIKVAKQCIIFRKKALKDQNMFIKFKVFDGNKIPFHDNFFDYIVCNGVLDHMLFSYAKELMEEFNRVLKPEGRIIMAVHSAEDSHYGQGEKIDKNTYLINWGKVETGLPQHYFTVEELEELTNNFIIINSYLHEDVRLDSKDSMWIVSLQSNKKAPRKYPTRSRHSGMSI